VINAQHRDLFMAKKSKKVEAFQAMEQI